MLKRRLLRAHAAMIFIVITIVLDVLGMGLVIPVMPILIEQLTGSNAKAGALNGIFVGLWGLMQFIASPIIGCLSDRFGRRTVILLSTAGLALDYMVMALAPNLWWLALGRVISGITSANLTTAYAYLADITVPENRVKAYGIVGAALSGGFIAGPLLGGLAGNFSPRAPFWLACGLSCIALLYGYFVLPESLPPDRRMAFSWRRANPFGAMHLLLSSRDLFGLAIVNFLIYFAHHAFSTVLVLYVSFRYGWSTWAVGILLMSLALLDLLVQGFLVNPANRFWGERRTMIIGLFSGAIGVVGIGLAPDGLWLALALLPNALWGLSVPTLQSLMTSQVSSSEQGQLQGANTSLASIAGVIAPLFFGAVYAFTTNPGPHDSARVGTAFIIAGIVLLSAGAHAWVMARRVGRCQSSTTRVTA